jgi:phosphoglycolate phosphatase-like HAD superfamily hydrolase
LKSLIIFDLDGVITSEESYWDCAGLSLHELICSPRYWNLAAGGPYLPATTMLEGRDISRTTLPEWLILSFKARSLNSNWDTCAAAVDLHLIALLARLPHRADLQPFAPWNQQWLATLRTQIALAGSDLAWNTQLLHDEWSRSHPFDQPIFGGATGLALFEHMDSYASQVLGFPVVDVFSRSKPFWQFCQRLFQEWLLGDALYTRVYRHAPAQTGKPGCIFFEEPLLPAQQIQETLSTLRTQGYTLGVASGRVRQEAAKPLERSGLLAYFDEQHMATYDVVVRAEAELRKLNNFVMLGKPHAFQFQAAADYEKALAFAQGQPSAPITIPSIAVGDSTSDILGGRAAGALTVAVLTGARTPEARQLLLQSQPDFVLADITELPGLLVRVENLDTIQKLQFEQRELAEKLLRLWFAREMNLSTESVRLTPKPVSLNSFNGFFRQNGQEYFFKTHIEEHGVLSEYYHAEMLDQAGYNVVQPLQLLHEKESQMVIYPVVEWPVMFDLLRAVETSQAVPPGVSEETLIEAERRACQQLLEIYQRSFQAAQDTREAPIHQLFWHRLMGRFEQFYAGKSLPLSSDNEAQNISLEQMLHAHWTINGVEQARTPGELIQQARQTLDPTRTTATVIGHGDAHFGNVFLALDEDLPRYLYFDPAFAGRHSPLLDVVKPLFHNVFATWMYFSREVAQGLQIQVRYSEQEIVVEHNYRLTPLRQRLLRTKQRHLLQPLVDWLRTQEALPEDWQEVLNLALMCCPLLTINLFDSAKVPPQVGWLGLVQAVQIGNRGVEMPEE